MSHLSKLGSYTLLCIASLTIMVGALVAPGLISISNALGINEYAVWLVTFPALGAVIFAPLAGKSIDKFGAYRSLIIGLILYGALGFAVYWLQGPWFVLSNRILLGGITAVVMASSTVLISQWYVGNERLSMIAKQGMAIELGGVLFLFLGGKLASLYWAYPLSLYLVAWLFLLMLLLFVPRKSPSLSDETQGNAPQAQQGLSLKQVYLFATLAMVVFFTAIVQLPNSMAQQGFNEAVVGNVLAFISLVAVVAAHFMPKVVKYMSTTYLLAIAFAAYALGHIVFANANGLPLLLVGSVFAGVGFGFSIPLLNHMTVEKSAANVRGKNLSYFTMAVFGGQFITSFVEFIPGGVATSFYSSMLLASLVTLALVIMQYSNNKRINQFTTGNT
ncbi:MFS transporter [Shewanella algicola]|uniref:MFS transporter n=1 Tax=Shewanella algicola TaxID=640633 RepID=UPI002494AC29|nr:MFS transporter [Shewanella algicola]